MTDRDFSDDILDPDEALVPPQSDEKMAILFATEYRRDLRYVAAWNRWYQWREHVWHPDDTLAAFDLARKIVRREANQINGGNAQTRAKEAKALASARTVAATVTLAKADRRLAATIDQWDADPMRLNTPGGVVDLTTGSLLPHRREDYMTKVTAAVPGGECPRWLAFLDHVMAGDKELVAYLRRVCGYMLTGKTTEHALFFLYGHGGNGKGVFVGTIAGILNDYHRAAPITTFTEVATDQHPTELAGLVGARAVTAAETEQGRRWAEAKIKSLTGGDRISARFMRQDFFEFTPAFKLMISGNHKPGLRSVDDAIRRRFNLIPFAVKISDAEKDPDLSEKLKAEWPGILQWMIEGCLEWQRIGLQSPKAVMEATDDYLASEDAVGLWIGECCGLAKDAEDGATELYKDWSKWAENNGERPGSQKQFGQRLEDRGLERFRNARGRTGYRGIVRRI
ncbi:phage/plasmid primase, P4 family [Aquibium sp. LZ166]|uniref:Phage/plasmid primase, P4 family n=1 Tax=Aquibium pacificus TaxID=3153579 RepID=A0ABV3SGU1_9HYPH